MKKREPNSVQRFSLNSESQRLQKIFEERMINRQKRGLRGLSGLTLCFEKTNEKTKRSQVRLPACDILKRITNHKKTSSVISLVDNLTLNLFIKLSENKFKSKSLHPYFEISLKFTQEDSSP